MATSFLGGSAGKPPEKFFKTNMHRRTGKILLGGAENNADDTGLTYASADLKLINDCVNDDLNKVYIWLSANKLTLNLTKTEFMLVGSINDHR